MPQNARKMNMAKICFRLLIFFISVQISSSKHYFNISDMRTKFSTKSQLRDKPQIDLK